MSGSATALVPRDAFAVTCPSGGDAVLQRARQPLINSGGLCGSGQMPIWPALGEDRK